MACVVRYASSVAGMRRPKPNTTGYRVWLLLNTIFYTIVGFLPADSLGTAAFFPKFPPRREFKGAARKAMAL